MTALLALLEDGTRFVLLHPRWTRAERARAIAMAGACLCIESGGAIVPAEASGPAGGRDPASSPRHGGIPEGAAIVFTSGTAGAPRGVVLSRAALLASARSHREVLCWRADDRWLLSLPAAHVGGLMIVVRCLQARRAVVVGGRGADGAFDAGRMLEVVERDRVTLLSVVPTMLQRMFRARRRPPASLRSVLVGGAAAPPALMVEAREFGWPVLATYGLTEACSQVATERPGDPLGGIGRAVPGVELAVGAPDRELARVAVPGADGGAVAGAAARADSGTAGAPDRRASLAGGAGPIRIRGPILFEGYLGDEPGAPLERPFDPDGWFDTGDLGTLDGRGRLSVAGRRSDRIVTGGENVDPLEVEAAVLEWPGAAAACVVGLEDEEWGERVGAVLVPAAGFEALGGLAGLERRLDALLAGFKLPRRWSVVRELPVAASGKVDRGACARLLAEGELETARGTSRAEMERFAALAPNPPTGGSER